MHKGILFLATGMNCISLWAHQPRIVNSQTPQPVVVHKPEISQAFYGTLTGMPHVYTITSPTSFLLYLNILAPDMPNAKTDFVVDVTQGDKKLITLPHVEWKKFYERFAGDNYLKGPEYTAQVAPGTYHITISNPDNTGQYILAVGKKEAWPINEIINTYRLLPGIKQEFFHKSPLSAFFNLFTLMLVIFIVLFILVMIGIIGGIRKLASLPKYFNKR